MSADLGVPLILSAPRETRFLTPQMPFVLVWPMFRASAGALASIFAAFPTLEVPRCGGVAAAAAAIAAVAVGSVQLL